MATRVSAEMERPSFAKVAANTSIDDPSKRSTTKIQAGQDNQPKSTNDRLVLDPVVVVDGSNTNRANGATSSEVYGLGQTISSLNNMKISSPVSNPVVVGGGASVAPPDSSHIVMSRASGSDESQQADSNSEIGTKPPSLDGKSITSGTTFALDEKESLRPDDSASVKAAEDDDTGSLLAGSRIGSEAAARARGVLIGDLADRRHPGSTPGLAGHGILTPQSTSSEQPPGSASSDALNVIYRQAPDDKLLDALATPKDRFFLLRLEKDVVDFVQNSKEPYMDLPPSNSFCRMLTHKLADYYHMTHSYEHHIGSVRIFRTPFCRVPPSLALMVPSASASTSSTPPPVVLPRKIMRRGQDGDSVPVSASPSKPASEDGSEAKDKQTPSNAKLSREQREEMYKLARERIFGSSEENSTVDNDGVTEMSRTSSVSNNRSNISKRGKAGKQRRDDSDSFDSRHSYTPYWGPQQQTWVPQAQAQPQWIGNGAQVGVPAMYAHQQSHAYAQPDMAYGAVPGSAGQVAYAPYPAPQYPPVPPQSFYRPVPGAPQPYGSPVPPNSAPPAPAQNWQQGYAQPTAYSARGQSASSQGPHSVIPYAYGQLPANANPNDPKSQHPIPGSYNRNQPFNPKTQSFTPTGGMTSVQAPQPPFTAPGSHHSSPQIGSPHLSYVAYQPTMSAPYGGAYAMARQGSSSSIPSYHMPQQGTPPHGSIMPVQHGLPQHLPHPMHQPSSVPSRPTQGPSSGNPMYSHLPTYGNPATLPQKPATGM